MGLSKANVTSRSQLAKELRGNTMARMHSRKKGKSGSVKPLKKVPSWTPYKKEKEVEKLVLKYGKAGQSTSEIGMTLRDGYGIPCVKTSTKKSVSQILKENNLLKDIPEDLSNLIKKLVAIKQHLEKNKQDQTAKRGLLLANSKIRRLTKYYKKAKKIPADWQLDMSRLKMYLD